MGGVYRRPLKPAMILSDMKFKKRLAGGIKVC
jgi:hypothetical protein